MTTFVTRGGKLVEKYGPEDDRDYSRTAAPMVQGDTPAYRSPITGHEVSGRRARREDLKRHNCIPVGGSDAPQHKGLTNGFRREYVD